MITITDVDVISTACKEWVETNSSYYSFYEWVQLRYNGTYASIWETSGPKVTFTGEKDAVNFILRYS